MLALGRSLGVTQRRSLSSSRAMATATVTSKAAGARKKRERASPVPKHAETKRAKVNDIDEKAEASQSVAPSEIARLNAEYPEWPARQRDIEQAREFLQRAAKASAEKILLVPDKDADGLSAGCIVKRTLIELGAGADDILLHHIRAGKAPEGNEQLARYDARWIIVMDQGSVRGAPLVPGAELGWQSDEKGAIRTMVIDHHHVNDLDVDCPQGALLVNASHHAPVSTSALLAWCICRPFFTRGAASIDYLALIGTCGDLSINVAWDAPWPDFAPELKRWGKSKIGKVVAMINAPRRTPEHDAHVSWRALDVSRSPLDVLDPNANPSFERLNEARRLVASETERQTHTPPKFSKDGRVALLTICSPYQVHPSIATRWSGSLKGAKKLEVVMCANTGFGEVFGESERRYVHFSCRRANAARARGEDPNIIELLHDYAARDQSFLTDMYASGHGSFARGHREASGGILPPPFWDRFVELMQIGIKPTPPPDAKPKSPSKKMPDQKNKLTNYFGTG